MEVIYFAELDETSKVINIIASGEVYDSIENEIDLLKNVYRHDRWVQTWRDGRERRQFAAMNGTYDKENDVFVDPKPEQYPSFVLVDGRWVNLVPKPDNYTEENWPSENGEYTEHHTFMWDEESTSWVLDIFELPTEDKP